MFKIELNIIEYFTIIMNKRINKCMEAHFAKFKHEILHTLQTTNNNMQCLNNFIENYKIPYIVETDYQKRHRTKNIVPLYERCMAKRADEEQCTRRKRSGDNFCGTHIKGTPHGTIDLKKIKNPLQKVDVWIQEIGGINYYIDGNNNVYDPQDVYQNKINPRLIHHYLVDEDGNYSIKE